MASSDEDGEFPGLPPSAMLDLDSSQFANDDNNEPQKQKFRIVSDNTTEEDISPPVPIFVQYDQEEDIISSSSSSSDAASSDFDEDDSQETAGYHGLHFQKKSGKPSRANSDPKKDTQKEPFALPVLNVLDLKSMPGGGHISVLIVAFFLIPKHDEARFEI
eukprot:gene100-707_t